MAQSGIATDDLSDGSRVVTFDAALYKSSAVKKAAYKYGGLFYVLIAQRDDHIEVRLKPKEPCTSTDALVGAFCNEVLDQELRETIAGETAGIRDLLLAQAFSKTTLFDPELETSEYDTEHSADSSEGQ